MEGRWMAWTSPLHVTPACAVLLPRANGARKDTHHALQAYLGQLLVDLQQAGPVDLGPAHAAGVAVVLNLGDSVHGVVAKGL